MPPQPPPHGPLLLAQGLRLQLGRRQILADLDFALEPGQRLLVRGASGMGKSTLLRALAGLVRLDAGRLELEGRGFREHGAPAWRRRVALVAQSAPVLPGTPAELAQELRGYAVHRGGPWDPPLEIAARLGLDPPTWTRDWAKLSGGERQRAHLALALAGRPVVLLLDEPTSALDPEATARVEAELAGRSAIWVSHDLRLAGRLQPDIVLELP